jgi:hypothetical protein
MKKPLSASDWAALWALRHAGFAIDMLPHSAPHLELGVYPGDDQVMIAANDNLTWVQVSVVLRASSWGSIVAASLLIDAPVREYHSVPRERVPTEVQSIFRRSRSKQFHFDVGGSSVLHVPPRLHLPGCLLFGGEDALPLLLPGQTLPAEIWLRDREGGYYGTGFAWRGGIELTAGAGEEFFPGEKPVPRPMSIS